MALETVFGGLGTEPRVARSALAESARRTRVSLVYDPAKRKLAAPVVVRQERRYDDALSLDVQEASGGRSGLDASWISCAVGINNFGEAKFEGAGGAARSELPGGVEVELELGSYPTPDALEVPRAPTARRRWRCAARSLGEGRGSHGVANHSAGRVARARRGRCSSSVNPFSAAILSIRA